MVSSPLHVLQYYTVSQKRTHVTFLTNADHSGSVSTNLGKKIVNRHLTPSITV